MSPSPDDRPDDRGAAKHGSAVSAGPRSAGAGSPRGGRQHIPRPPGTRDGGDPPWARLPPERRRLTLAEVRTRCASLPPPPPLVPGVGGRAAAVLLPLFEEDGEARLVLTKRPDTMPSHRGEIAFPGGKVESAVDATSQEAALREAQEEIGLDPGLVEIVGALHPLGTVLGQFSIEPFVGLIDGRPHLAPHEWEVASVFDVALSELLSDDVFREEIWTWNANGVERTMQFYELVGETVWGATARIITGFLAHLTGTDGPGDWSEPPLGATGLG
jgi:8-oxo-dGTP pyrophosphatase MutT (NUDIX family)